MKKLIFLLSLTLCFLVSCNEKSSAQTQLYKSTSTIAGITNQATDTLTNTETTYFSTRKGALASKDYTKFRFSFKADTTSGTPPTISVIVQGSVDGVKWYRFSGAALGTDGYNSDSLSVTTAANEYFTISEIVGGGKYVYGVTAFNLGMKCNYLRLMMVVASGTHNTIISDAQLITAQ